MTPVISNHNFINYIQSTYLCFLFLLFTFINITQFRVFSSVLMPCIYYCSPFGLRSMYVFESFQSLKVQ